MLLVCLLWVNSSLFDSCDILLGPQFQAIFVGWLKPLLRCHKFLGIAPYKDVSQLIHCHNILWAIFDKEDEKKRRFVGGEELSVHVLIEAVVRWAQCIWPLGSLKMLLVSPCRENCSQLFQAGPRVGYVLCDLAFTEELPIQPILGLMLESPRVEISVPLHDFSTLGPNHHLVLEAGERHMRVEAYGGGAIILHGLSIWHRNI